MFCESWGLKSKTTIKNKVCITTYVFVLDLVKENIPGSNLQLQEYFYFSKNQYFELLASQRFRHPPINIHVTLSVGKMTDWPLRDKMGLTICMRIFNNKKHSDEIWRQTFRFSNHVRAWIENFLLYCRNFLAFIIAAMI